MLSVGMGTRGKTRMKLGDVDPLSGWDPAHWDGDVWEDPNEAGDIESLNSDGRGLLSTMEGASAL